MIDSLLLRNVASYDGTGVKISDLKKVNFIYGANGSGKTTLSKLVADPTGPNFSDCRITWKNGLEIKALVYNKDFKEKNFGRGSIDGVFTLGQASKEHIEAIEKMKAELQVIKDNNLKRKRSRDEKVAEQEANAASFKDVVWSALYKKYESEFKEAFRGHINKKEAFRDHLLNTYENNKTKVLEYEVLKRNAITIFGEPPVSILPITTLNYGKLHAIETDNLWNKKIIGKADVDIAKLISTLNMNDWVSQGIHYLQEDDKTCPFCQQKTIDSSFRKQLEDYFDESYTTDIASIKTMAEEYDRLAQNVENLLDKIEEAEKQKSIQKLDIEKFSAFVKTIKSQFVANRELIHAKLKEPSRTISLTNSESQAIEIDDLIKKANAEIEKHNKIVDNYAQARTQLVNGIWRYISHEYDAEITDYLKKQGDLQKAIDALNTQHAALERDYTALNNKIKEANKNVTSVQPTVDEINKLLKSFGFVNFEIVPSKVAENQYQIQREDGTIAESTLSEGEITFITFLYFLQLAKGGSSAENVSDERILVIDDPISSLDSNILFVVSSLLKQIIKNIRKDVGVIRQLILLTHNVYFHKEASFIDGRTQVLNDTFYWIIRRNGKVSSAQCYETKNPIQNSYGLLWQELRNKENNSGVTIQNTMRRIIENYFKILGKYGDDELIQAFQSNEEQEICRSLICWINDGSHSIPDDLYIEHHEAVTEKYFQVFEGIFTQLGHPEHYRMMMGN